MMDMNAASVGGVVVVDEHNQVQLHAQPPEEQEDQDDVMVDLSCFGGGCYNINAAMEEADHQDLMDNAAAIFCDDLIPPLPDFQCMSSSSSSSSSSAAVKPVVSTSYRSTASSAVSSSSASSWAVLRSDGEDNQHTTAAGSNCNYLHKNSNHQQVAMSSTASMDPRMMHEQSNNNGLLPDEIEDEDDIGCMDVMETLGYMDLLDDNSQAVWDYNDSFNSQQNNFQEQQQGFQCNQQTETNIDFKDGVHVTNCDKKGDNLDDIDGLDKSEDLAMVFFEWLKSNKESISAEDLRSIKLRKSTIESAARRLGNGKVGMKRLLQLILEWVQHHQLQRKRSREVAEAAAGVMGQAPQFQQQMYPVQYQSPQFQNTTTTDSNLNVQPDHHTQFAGSANQAHWNMNMGSGGGAGFDPMMAVGVPAAGAGIINGDSFGNNNTNSGCHHFSNMVDQSAAAWPAAPPFCMNYNNNANAAPNLTTQPYPYGTSFNQYPYHYYPAVGNGNNNAMNGNVNEEGFARTGSSATKEARKKRMMRQRRFLPHHRHHHHNSNSNGHHHNNNGHSSQINMPMGGLGTATSLGRFNVDENCSNMGHPGSGNWAYWKTAVPPPPIPLVSNVGKLIQANDVGSSPMQQRPTVPERRQGSKPEKNLRFLLQKVLKQSDVGSLGRIVLPKKEAEIHLPQLTARDGINIAMEDIGTSQVWNMRYRFWPNNKSRMYLLENTGDFVKSNGLQEGDFIVIYSDIKCGKYMIRGVKVRQQGPKSDTRRCGKSLKKNPSDPTSNSSPSGIPNNKDALLKSRIEEPNMDLQMFA